MKNRMEYRSDYHKQLVEQSRIDEMWWENDFKIHDKKLVPYYEDFEWITKGESLLLIGNPGCWKTGQIMTIAKKYLHERGSFRYYRATEIVYQKDLEKIKTMGLLVIDNLGYDKDFENSRGCLFDLVDYRLHNYLSTVLITNEKVKFDSAFMDRLKMFTKIIIERPSTRGENK